MTKNITFSADINLIEAARAQAKNNKTTLNSVFQDWLESYVEQQAAQQRKQQQKAFLQSVATFSVTTDRKFTREEMNQR